jgi:hypothetical protein
MAEGILLKYGAILADPPWQFMAYRGPRIAQRWPGWDAMGDEVEKFVA